MYKKIFSIIVCIFICFFSFKIDVYAGKDDIYRFKVGDIEDNIFLYTMCNNSSTSCSFICPGYSSDDGFSSPDVDSAQSMCLSYDDGGITEFYIFFHCRYHEGYTCIIKPAIICIKSISK